MIREEIEVELGNVTYKVSVWEDNTIEVDFSRPDLFSRNSEGDPDQNGLAAEEVKVQKTAGSDTGMENIRKENSSSTIGSNFALRGGHIENVKTTKKSSDVTSVMNLVS